MREMSEVCKCFTRTIVVQVHVSKYLPNQTHISEHGIYRSMVKVIAFKNSYTVAKL